MVMNPAGPPAPSTRRYVRVLIVIAALLLVVSMVLTGSGLTGTTQAQAERGAIPSMNLDSDEPGQLVITWETLDPHPTDYRLSWAHSSLGFLSYRDSNEAEKGNVYPAGSETTLTWNGLTPGQGYKVQPRARYYNADRSVHEWSGPWTATATIMDEPAEPLQPEDQTENKDPTATPPPAEQTDNEDPPAAPTGLTVARVGHSVLTLAWNDPKDDSITGYRILRGSSEDNLSVIEEDTGSAGTEYTDDTLAAENTYFYAVLALSQDGDGVQSSTISATTPAEPTSEDQTRNVVPKQPSQHRRHRPARHHRAERIPRSGGAESNEATASTYTLADAHEGKTIKVQVSFTDF